MSNSMVSWKSLAPYRPAFARSSASEEQRSRAANLQSYQASCHCGRVRYEVRQDPLNAKLCHCRGCQKLHGAPFEWVAVFPKENVRFSARSSLDFLHFYSSELDQGWDASHAQDRVLPVKVSCAHCRAPIADEGRHMWLAYCTLFGFTVEGAGGVPESFQHSCHLFYNQRCVDLPDDKTKWQGHRNKSPEWKP